MLNRAKQCAQTIVFEKTPQKVHPPAI